MCYQVYQFEAVSIQDYILAGGKLKTMVGASELLEAITNELLDIAIKSLGLKVKPVESLPIDGELNLAKDEVVFPRRAGSVFLMVLQNAEKAQRFAELWPILVSNFAPGLNFSATLQSGYDFYKVLATVRTALNVQKNQPQTVLPESTPLTVRFQKTGLAQVRSPSGSRSGQDWTMPPKMSEVFTTLANKHLSEDKLNQFVFPKQFEHKHTETYWKEAFPFKSTDPGNHTVGIIHTDGNGLGIYLHKIFDKLNQLSPAEYIQAYARFSQGLNETTEQAAKAATDWLITTYQNEKNPYKDKVKSDCLPLPMRPIILGGDDLTCIVRADLALGFVKAFTEAFETKSAVFIQSLPKVLKDVLPDKLTCTTGVLFLKSNQPFSLGYALAEELCSDAKKVGRKLNNETPPSLINFLHTTNTLFDRLETQLKQELETSSRHCLSCMPYAFKSQQGRPTLQQLFELSECFDEEDEHKLNPSAMRRYASYLHQNKEYAQLFWERWQKQASEKNSATEKVWHDFESRWSSLRDGCQNEKSSLPVTDLITLFALEIQNPYQEVQA